MALEISFKEAFRYWLKLGFISFGFKWRMIPVIAGSAVAGFIFKSIL